MSWLSSALGAVTGIGSIFNAHQTNQIAQSQFEANMDLQKNRHQYEVKDLQAAGLNPILSANNGNVSSVPSTAGARVDPFASAMSAVSSAAQIGALASQINKNNADAKLASASADTQLWQRWEMESRIALNNITGKNLAAEALEHDARVKVLNAQEQNILKQNEKLVIELKYLEPQIMADLQVKQAQIYQLYASGAMSYAAATASYASAVASYALAGKLNQETQNLMQEGFGIMLKNDLLQNDLDVARAKAPYTTNSNWQTGFGYIRDITGAVGDIGKIFGR